MAPARGAGDPADKRPPEVRMLARVSAPILALALVSLASPARAAEEKAAEPAIVLRAAHLFDGTSEKLVSPGVVVVAGGKIVAAGANAQVPDGARTIDLGDATLLPGLMDAHVHLTGESSDNFYRDLANGFLQLPPERVLHAVPYAKRTLEAGFTTVRNVGADDYLDVGLRNAIAAGDVEGPRMLIAVHAIGSTGGHGDGVALDPTFAAQPGPIRGVCNGPEECRAAVRFQIKYGADVIKVMPSGGVLSLTDPVDAPEMTQAEMDAVVSEAHNWGRKVAAHCHGDAAAKIAISAGVDSIEHGSFIQADTLGQMKRKGIYLVPTLLAGETVMAKADKFPPVIAGKARSAVAARSDMFKNALRLGVPIAFGTDSAVSQHGQNGKEFALMTGLGMSPAAALRSATSDAAELLGLSKTLGTLEKGKVADVIAVRGNPLADIHTMEKPVLVMKEGRIWVQP
jgi:imidazolonepropionase-like amidohydrolase